MRHFKAFPLCVVVSFQITNTIFDQKLTSPRLPYLKGRHKTNRALALTNPLVHG